MVASSEPVKTRSGTPSRLKSAAATPLEDGAAVTRSVVCVKGIAACEDWVQAVLNATTMRMHTHWSVLVLGFIGPPLLPHAPRGAGHRRNRHERWTGN